MIAASTAVAARGGHVLVIGAGPAGLAATAALVRRGVAVTLVDRYDRGGGQIARQPGDGSRPTGSWAGLLTTLEHPRARLLAGTATVALQRVAADAPSDRDPAASTPEQAVQAILQTAGRLHTVVADAVVLATGAREAVTPFAGWTLPGVVTAGAVQAVLKREGAIPWRRVGLAGSGPLLLAVAQAMRQAQHPPVFTLERQPLHRLALRGAGTAAAFPAKAALFGRLAAAAPPRFGWRVVEAVAGGGPHDEVVRAAVICRRDRRGRDVGHRTVALDALAVSARLVPDVALALQLGCTSRASADGVATAVVVDADQRTSVPKVYAAGEITGVGGAEKSVAEGRLAGLAAAADLARTAVPAVGTLRQEVARWRRFGSRLERLYPFDHGWEGREADTTMVCRCEEVALGTVRRAMADGAHTARAVKGLTRTGMGRCQGAVCSPVVRSALVAAGHGDTGDLESRPLAEPVTLAQLARLAAAPTR
ncbi:MAG TPA: NAD(P)/FAD-dependent oxidoreductase [Euzebya sp.]|nr:NAD(P)/FAD-dependent oxidoreductase [Euzebya sp.]